MVLDNTPAILIIAPAWVGDAVMAQVLFKQLKQATPGAQLDVLAPAWTSPVFLRMPEVSQVILAPLKHGKLAWRTRCQLAKRLRYYQQAIVLPNSFKSALIPWLANIPRRTGWLGEYRYLLLNDIHYRKKGQQLRTVEQFALLARQSRHDPFPAPLSYPRLSVCHADAAKLASQHGLDWQQQPVLVLGLGAAFGPSKCWPAPYFAAVARYQLQAGWAVWLMGTAQEQAIADFVNEQTQGRCQNLTGQCSLTETIDLLSLAKGVIAHDSGLMHLAAALEKPLIALYGSTSSQLTPPLSSQATILSLHLACQPCFERTCPLQHHHCLRELLPEQVLASIASWQSHQC